MQITEIKVFPVQEDKLKAYVTVVIDDCFVIRDLKIIKGTEGLFIAMPSKRRKDGTFKDIAHPTNPTTRLEFEQAILKIYLEQVSSTETASTMAAVAIAKAV
jgi:stage V sporulation protein G